MLFYRYQNTTNIETKSRYIDLALLKEDFSEYAEEYDDDLDKKLYLKYMHTLCLRGNISAEDLFLLVKNTPLEDSSDLAYEYPLDGFIFGMIKDETDQYYNFDELISGLEPPWACDGYKYLVLYDGDLISDEGEISGCIFKPKGIKEILVTDFN